MNCLRCGSEKVNIQVVEETKLVDKGHGIIWWIFIAPWYLIIKWIFFFPLALLAKIFIPKKQTIKQKIKSVAVCQECGYKKYL